MNRRDAEIAATRFGVDREEVEEANSKVEEEKAVELELRTIKRDTELMEFLRYTYDQEASTNECQWEGCGKGPWKYYDELIAHMRTHIILKGGRQASSAMNAVDKLIAPVQEAVAKVSLPSGEDADKLFDRLAKGLARRISNSSVDSRPERSLSLSDKEQSIDIEATEVPVPGLIQIANESDPNGDD